MSASSRASAKDTLASYRKKGLAGRVGFGKRPAVLVVDFILGFTNERSPLAGNFDREIAATKKVLTRARKSDVPVFYTTTFYDKRMTEAGLFVSKVPSLALLKEGSRHIEVDPRLKRKASEIVVVKKYASAFFGTTLAATLTALEVDTVIVTGCTTSGCVRASVVDALQHGFRPVVPRECVGDRSEAQHEANLVDIDGKYGDVMSLDELLRAMSQAKPLPRTRTS